MNVAVLNKTPSQKAALAVVDCDIHPSLRTPADLDRYMPARWVDYARTFGGALRQPFSRAGLYPRNNRDGGARLDAKPPTGGPSGSDLAFMRTQHLDPNNIEVGILQPFQPQTVAQRNQDFAAAYTAAVNDWQVDTWCAPEPRLKGSIMVTREDPAAALREIQKHAGSPHFVQISTMPQGIEPLGRQRYWPIFEAAEALNLPIGLHVGGVTGIAPTGAGWPSFYIEEHHSKSEAMQSLVVSLVSEGVFDRFPRLRVVLIEGGYVWVPSLCWRMDQNYARFRSELPQLKRLPSEYVRDHFWYTTQPVEEPDNPQHLAEVMDWVGWDRILFSTDYPHWDFDDPRYAFKFAFAPERKQMVFRDNARALYGLG
ncbi:amidohydrolase family protein [Roseomonas sp. BN140053]|uniref:amidohydrolase family protein n=1 Tax=Roseomonas sp. BN140053 TaxID=3391898 RepID=UPI0039E7F3A8